jgi:hypothetical protein
LQLAPANNAAMGNQPSAAEPLKRKRPRFQFSMRTLLIGVTLLAVPLGYVGWQVKIVRERKATFERLLADPKNFGVIYDFWPLPDDVETVSRSSRGLLPLDMRHSVTHWASHDRPSAFYRWLGEPDMCVVAICISADDQKIDVDRLGELFPKALIRQLR